MVKTYTTKHHHDHYIYTVGNKNTKLPGLDVSFSNPLPDTAREPQPHEEHHINAVAKNRPVFAVDTTTTDVAPATNVGTMTAKNNLAIIKRLPSAVIAKQTEKPPDILVTKPYPAKMIG